MSAKRNVIVPAGFTAAQALRCTFLNRFHHLTNREAEELRKAGKIRQLAERVWQCIEQPITHGYKETERGRVSLEIPKRLQDFMAVEMAGHPSWALMERQ